MAGIQLKKMNWFSKTSAWKTAEAWREKRRAMSEQFQSEASVASSAFTSAWSNNISGQGTITAEAALKRIQTATALAKQAAAGVDITA